MPLPTIFRDVVTCGTWTFNDPNVLPTGVYDLGIDILDGWDDTSPVDVLVSSRGDRDGDIPAAHFPLRSKKVTLSGWAKCTDRIAARQAFTALCASAFPSNVDLTLTRAEPDAAKQMTVRRAGSIELPAATNVTGPEFRFLVPLQAFDPLKYAVALDINATAGIAGLSSGGLEVPVVLPAAIAPSAGEGPPSLISAHNAGSYDTRPVTTITGPLPTGWHWSNTTTGLTFQLDQSLGVGDSLVLDHRTETAILNGYPVSPAITGDWWAIAPGDNVLRLYGDFDPAASVTVVARSAWE